MSECSSDDSGATDSAVHIAMRSRQWSFAAVLLALAHVGHALSAESSAPVPIFVTARMPDFKVSHEDVRPPPLLKTHAPVLCMTSRHLSTWVHTGTHPLSNEALSAPQAYLCTAVQLPDQALKLVGVEPLAKQEIAHHMLLFGAYLHLLPFHQCCAVPLPMDASPERTAWQTHWQSIDCRLRDPCQQKAGVGLPHAQPVRRGAGEHDLARRARAVRLGQGRAGDAPARWCRLLCGAAHRHPHCHPPGVPAQLSCRSINVDDGTSAAYRVHSIWYAEFAVCACRELEPPGNAVCFAAVCTTSQPPSLTVLATAPLAVAAVSLHLQVFNTFSAGVLWPSQVHYQIVRPEGDHTGVRLELTPEPQPFSAGMFTYASGFVVPPQDPAFHVPATCCYAGWERIRAFAFRVHAHSLGRHAICRRHLKLKASCIASRTVQGRVCWPAASPRCGGFGCNCTPTLYAAGSNLASFSPCFLHNWLAL